MSRYVNKKEIKFVYFSLGVMWVLVAAGVPTLLNFFRYLTEGASIRDAVLAAWGLL